MVATVKKKAKRFLPFLRWRQGLERLPGAAPTKRRSGRDSARYPAGAPKNRPSPGGRKAFYAHAVAHAQPWIFSPRASMATNFSTRAHFVSGFTAVCTRQQNA